MPLDFAREAFCPALMSEMVPLIVRHFREVSHFRDVSIEPDFDHYVAAEAAGILRIYTARTEGKLVGYSVFVVTQHPHFKGLTQANEELLFLDPEHRKGSLGLDLIDYCDNALKHEGVNIVFHTVSQERDFSPLLVRRGYELCDQVYARRFS